MNIQIQARNFSLTEAMKNHIKMQIKHVLNAGAEQIQRIQVRLSDINGSGGGIDKTCLIQVKLTPHTELVIADTHSDLYAAIEKATDRLSMTLARKLKRPGSKQRANNWQLYQLPGPGTQAEY